MQTCDPLEARQQFKRMVIKNWAIILGAFIPAVFILQIFIPFIFADAIAIAAAFYFLFFILRKRTVAIACPGCGKTIESNTIWECGACGRINRRVYDYPFINHCENPACGCEPKAYKCPDDSCGELIFLSSDESELNYARSFDAHAKPQPVSKPVPREPSEQEKEQQKFEQQMLNRQRNIKLKGLDVEESVLDVRLQELKGHLNPIKPKSLKELLRSGVLSKTVLDDEVCKMKAEAAIEFADNPAALEKRIAAIESEARELI
jgi:hypothetical protein